MNTENPVIHAIRTRRSVRSYRSQSVSREVLATIVDCGRLAPSANNRQSWEFVVVTKPAALKSLAELASHAHAPTAGSAHPQRSGWMMGAVFALAGLRNALMALPIAMHRGLGLAVAALLLFGLGITSSMIAYGLVFSAAQHYAHGRGIAESAMRVAVGITSAAFGVVWIVGA